MLRVTHRPTAVVKVQQKIALRGGSDPSQAGKPLMMTLDEQMTVPSGLINPDGSWQVELSFQKPGKYAVVLGLDHEQVEVTIPVVAENPLPGETSPSPTPSSNGSDTSKHPTLRHLIEEAFAMGASDIHLGVNKIPRFRHLGQIQATNYPVADEITFFNWLREVIKEKDIRQFQTSLELDASAQFEFTRIRINVYSTQAGPALVCRLIPLQVQGIAELGLPGVFETVCQMKKGLVLLTGPTGVGKSTSLGAIIDHINHTMNKHIVTIEDPIEFVHESDQSVVSQREVGLHTQEFNSALRAALRADPDIIMIGELRDRAIVDTALNAAQTGHVVFATLHTNSAVKTVERILNFYNPEEQAPMRTQVSECLAAVIAQGLAPSIDGKRVAYHEIMISTDAVKDYIRRGELAELEVLIPNCRPDGMCTSNQSLFDLFKAGRITRETSLLMSSKPNELMIMYRSSGDRQL